MPIDNGPQYEITLPGGAFARGLDSLARHLKTFGPSGEMAIDRTAKEGDSTHLGPLEIITVVVASAKLLLELTKLIVDWQKECRRRQEPVLVARIEADDFWIDVRLKDV